MEIADLLRKDKGEIDKRLQLGVANWDDLVARIDRADRRESGVCADEQVWTFLLACLYAEDEQGPSILANRLIDAAVATEKIWFEVLPESPRHSEGMTNLDLALGNLSLRQGTSSGIKLTAGTSRSIVFCEFKWFSDIAVHVTHAKHRNQLARVIENAMFFHSKDGEYPEQANVCLVTPGVYRDRRVASRLYRYKWDEYSRAGHELLIADLEQCGLTQEAGLPNIRRRLQSCSLNLKWKSYEEVAFAAPKTPILDMFKKFYSKRKGAELPEWPAD